jgi:hypothetical protein
MDYANFELPNLSPIQRLDFWEAVHKRRFVQGISKSVNPWILWKNVLHIDFDPQYVCAIAISGRSLP